MRSPPVVANLDGFNLHDKNRLLTASSHIWGRALDRVNKDAGRVTGNLHGRGRDQILRGYVYPPPQLFLQSDNYMEYTLCWAVVREFWFGEITVALSDLTRTRAPKAATWRSLFHTTAVRWMPTAFGPKGTGAKDKKRKSKKGKPSMLRRTEKRNTSVEDSFSFINALTDHLPRAVEYNGAGFIKDEELVADGDIVMLMMWELEELNFRSEVVITDRILAEGQWNRDENERNNLVLRMFPEKRLRPRVPFVSFSESFGAVHSETEAQALLETDTFNSRWSPFWVVLKDWKGSERWDIFRQNNGLPIVDDQPPTDRYSCSVIAEDCAQFYCQAFFDMFGRAPVTPRAFPTSVARYLFSFRFDSSH